MGRLITDIYSLSSTETTSVKDTTDRIEVTVREIMQRLIEDGSSEITAATVQTTSSYILQRYLSSASSVFSSRPTSPVARTSLDVIEEQEEEKSGGSYQRVRKDGRGQDMRYESEKDDWSSDIIDFNLKSQSRNSLEGHREKVQEQQVSRREKKREVKYKHKTEDLLTSKNRTQKPPRVREGDSKERILLPGKEQGVEPGPKTDKFSTTTSKPGLKNWLGGSQQNPKKVSQPYVPLREQMRQSPLGVLGNSSWDQQVPWWEKEKTQLEDTVPGRKVPIVSKTSLGSDPQTHSSAQSFDLPTVPQRDFGFSRPWLMAPVIAKETQRQEHTTPSSEIQTAAGSNFGQNRWLGLKGHNKEMQQLEGTVPSWGVQGASGTLPGLYLKPGWMLMGKELEAKKAEKVKIEENTRMDTSSMSHGAIKLIDPPLFQSSALQRVLGRIAEEEKAEKEKAEKEKAEKEKAEGGSVWELMMSQEISANFREFRAIIEKKKAEKEKAEKEKAEKEKAERGRIWGLMMSQGVSANLQELQAIIEKQKAEKEKAEAAKTLRDVNTRLREVGISYTIPSIARWDALIAKDSWE